MKLFLVALFAGVCFADRLENTYLPPSSASGAGGNENLLLAPHPSVGQYRPSSPFGQGSKFYRPQYNPQPQFNNQYYAHRTGGYQSSGEQIPIVKYVNENQGDGNYHFDYETANGIKAQEHGHPASPDEEVVQGSYSYTGDDGQVYSVSYKADGNGFQPSGAHLPTPPPIPEAIQKSLAFNAAEEARNPHAYQYGGDDGQYSSGGSGQYSGAHAGQYTGGSSGQYTGGSSGQYSGGSSGHYFGGRRPYYGGFSGHSGVGGYSGIGAGSQTYLPPQARPQGHAGYKY